MIKNQQVLLGGQVMLDLLRFESYCKYIKLTFIVKLILSMLIKFLEQFIILFLEYK